jgi:hypothetical protein
LYNPFIGPKGDEEVGSRAHGAGKNHMDKPNQSISKPLLITLIVVAAIGAIYYAWRSFGGGESGENGQIPGVLPVPDNLPRAVPQPGEPGMAGGGGN